MEPPQQPAAGAAPPPASPAEIALPPLPQQQLLLPSFEEMYHNNPDFPLPWSGFGPSPVQYFSIQELNEAIRQVVQRTAYPHLEACALANTHVLVQGRNIYLKQQDMTEQRGKDRADVLLSWSQPGEDAPLPIVQPGFASWEEIDSAAFVKQWAVSAPNVLVPIPEALQPPPGPRGGQGERKPPKLKPFWRFWLESPYCNSTGQRLCLFLRRSVWRQIGVSRANRVISGRKIWPTFRPFISWYRYDTLAVQKHLFGHTARQVWQRSVHLQQFITHVFHVLCDSNPTLCYAFFMILAQIMQQPGVRTERIVQCMGDEGGGKTTTMRMITSNVMGPGTSTFVTRIGDLTGTFTGHKLRHSPLLIYIDEQITERNMQGIFNNYVSADRYTVENKYGSKSEAEGGATIITTANINLGISQGGGKGRRQLILLMRDHLKRLTVPQRVAYFGYWDSHICNNQQLADELSTFLQVIDLQHWLLEAPSMDLTNRSSAAGVHQVLRELGKSEVASERVTYHWAQALNTLRSCCKQTDPKPEPEPSNLHTPPPPDPQTTLPFVRAVRGAAAAAPEDDDDGDWTDKWVSLKAMYEYATDHGMPKSVSYQDFRVQTELLMRMPTRMMHNAKQYQLPSIADGRAAFIRYTGIDLNAEEREAEARLERPAELDLTWATQFDPPRPQDMVPIDAIFARECSAAEDAQPEPPPPPAPAVDDMERVLARSVGAAPPPPPSPTLPRHQLLEEGMPALRRPREEEEDSDNESDQSLYTRMQLAREYEAEYQRNLELARAQREQQDVVMPATPEAEQDAAAEREDRRRHKRQRVAERAGIDLRTPRAVGEAEAEDE